MTKLSHNLGMKVFACFLVIIMGFVALASGLGVFIAGASGFYSNQPLSYAETPYCENTTYSYAEQVMDRLNSNMALEEVAERFGADRTNFRFELFSPENKPLLSNFDKKESPATYIGEYRFSLYYDYGDGILVQEDDSSVSITFDAATATEAVAYSEPLLATMRCYVAEPLTVSDHYWISYQLYQLTFHLHNWLILILAGSTLILAATLIYLLCAAGHQNGTDEIVPNLQDKIPL
ncbi:MAG: hypothetical protein ACI4AO_04575, partial [Anaerotignum sp.]